jgi:hypothetical protein
MAQYDHWIPLNVGDYLADTMHLTTIQHGIYVKWIMHYWKRRELPWELRQLAQIAGLTVDKLRRCGGPVLALFTDPDGQRATLPGAENDSLHPHLPGGKNPTLRHRRLDVELFRAREVSEIKKTAGVQGAKARWGKRTNDTNVTDNYATTDGICHPFANGSRVRATPTTTTTDKIPPLTPRTAGGAGARGDISGGKSGSPRANGTNPRAANGTNGHKPKFRNGFAASLARDLQERIDHAADADARSSDRGAIVVPILGFADFGKR